MTVNKILRKLRESHHLQISDVADAIGMSRQGYNNYETGSRNPSLDTIVRLAKFYNVSTDYILGVSDSPDNSVVTQDEIKAIDEKAEKLFQSFLQLPNSTKVSIKHWIENAIPSQSYQMQPASEPKLSNCIMNICTYDGRRIVRYATPEEVEKIRLLEDAPEPEY